MPKISVTLFGAFSTHLESQKALAFRSVSVKALFIYLVAERDRGPHRREVLSELIWPGFPPESSRKNLRQALYELRQAIPQAPSQTGNANVPLTLADRQTIQLNPEAALHSDIHLFEQLRHKKNTESLQQAVDLYRGDFLADFYLPGSSDFEEWAAAKRAYYRREVLEALTVLARHALENGDYSQADTYARRQLELDPLHEPAYRQLMEALAEAGRRPEALERFNQLSRLLEEELDVEPSAQTIALHKAILAGHLEHPATSTPVPSAPGEPIREDVPLPNNLPAQATAFIGRTEEIREIHQLVVHDPDCRLLTLHGPGGIGKSRLGLEVCERIVTDSEDVFPDGVWLVPLDKLADPESIPFAISGALDFQSYDQSPIEEQLLGFLSQKKMLLLLDNYEHLLQPDLMPFAAEINSSAPQVKVMVTSRSLLNTHAEYLWPVSGLALPDQNDETLEMEISSFDALRLFEQSAQRAQPGFTLDADCQTHVLEICRLLQGMPLGIELAAAWLPILSLPEIAREIAVSLDFLESRWRDLPGRQRSLRAVFESSWNMLSAREREAIGTLSIFQGEFSSEAARTVSKASALEMMALSGKSWLKRQPSGWHQIHVMLRQFCREKLSQDELALDEARIAHARYHFSWLEGLSRAMRGPDQRVAFQEAVQAFEDVRAAWDWALGQGLWELFTGEMLAGLLYLASARASQAVVILAMFRDAREKIHDPGKNPLLEAMLGTAEASLSHGFFVPSHFALWIGISALPEELIRQGWERLRSLRAGDIDPVWLVLSSLLYGTTADKEQAAERLRQLIRECRLSPDRWALAYTIENLGRMLGQAWFPSNIRYLTPDERALWGLTDTSGMERAVAVQGYLEEAAELWKEVGDGMQRADTLRLLAFTVLRRDPERGLAALEEARSLYEELGNHFLVNTVLHELAQFNLQKGNIEEALKQYRQLRLLTAKLFNRQASRHILSMESINTARYGDLEDARKLRHKNLDIARELGDDIILAWSLWEMGEIERLAGNLDGAVREYQRARVAFAQREEPVGLSFYYKGIGDISLAREDFEEARRCFNQALGFSRGANHDWTTIYCLCGLASAQKGLGQLEDAWQALNEALREARLIGMDDLIPKVFVCLAQWHGSAGDWDRALTLASFAYDSNTAWNETKELAQDVMKEATSVLPAERAHEAVERARSLDLPAAVLLALGSRPLARQS